MEHHFCPYCMNPVEEGKPCAACGLTQGTYTPSPHHLPPGTVLKGRYLVGRVLGEGGFGITYIGCDLQLELKVAIKEYFPTDKASRVSQASLEVASYTGAAGVHYDRGLKRFLQEARTIARMDKQPVIVNVRDFFEVHHTAYIVMEYVEGTTFKDLVEQRGGRIPAGQLLYLMEPLFFALKEMHANGLIHRDISPENLMLEKGEVRLLDFGCARESADGGNTMTIALKHGYAPVEQYQSKGQGPWTDVYALSATIYYCLTGKKPPQAMDRLVEDELVPPRKLGVDLTQRQEQALLHGMGVAPKRRFQSMDEFHTALYEGFVPDAAEPAEEIKAGPSPAGPADASEKAPDGAADAAGAGPDKAERTAETTNGTDKAPSSLMGWLEHNKLLAGGCAAVLALLLLLAVFLPRQTGPAGPAEPVPTAGPSSQGAAPAQSADPDTDYLALCTETIAWLRQAGPLELDEAELRARLDDMPIDGLFADAEHVSTAEELEAALEREDGPIVIDADIDYSSRRNNLYIRVPVLISEGAAVTVAWADNDGGLAQYDLDEPAGTVCTVDSSILVNRGTLCGEIVLGSWSGAGDTNLLLNYGTIHSSLGAGYDYDSENVLVNLGILSISDGQFRQSSFYNLGSLLHGSIAPEGQIPVFKSEAGGDYFIDLIGCSFYNSGEILLEGQSERKRSRLDIAFGSQAANTGAIQIGSWGQLNLHASLLNTGAITVTGNTGHIENWGWLCNSGPDCSLDVARCNNTGLIQTGPETSVNLTAGRNNGGAVLPFGWWEGMSGLEGYRWAASEDELYEALADRDCRWVVINDGTALTLTEDLLLTKGLALTWKASLTLDGCGLTVAGEDGYLYSDAVIEMRGGQLTVRDEGTALVSVLEDCGGVSVRSGGRLMLRAGLMLDEGSAVGLADNGWLYGIGPLELGGSLRLEGNSGLRATDSLTLTGCTAEVGEGCELLIEGCSSYFDPDTTITNYGSVSLNGWDPHEIGCSFQNYGWLWTNANNLISGSLVNHGRIEIWCGEGERIRVSGALENHGAVSFPNEIGQFQPWAAGTVTGLPESYLAG